MPGNVISDSASVATLILFVIYFVGRVITIVKQRNIYNDRLEILLANDEQVENNIVEDFYLEDNPYNVFIITSVQGIWELKIYRNQLDENFNTQGQEKVAERSFLNMGQSVAIHLTIPEMISSFCVEYITCDFKKVHLELVYNMKSGVLSEIVRPSHTWKSILYYLFR